MRPALQEPLNRLQRSEAISLPALVGGWNARDSITNMPQTDCVQLDNWIVRTQAIQTRLGARDWATEMPPSAVESLLPYGSQRLFAAVGDFIYDVTAQGVVGSPVQTGLLNARWQHVNYSNSAGNFLIIVNGRDSYRYWNGFAWTSVPSFTFQPDGTAYSTANLFNITVYRNRLYFCANNDLAFYFLDAGAIQGDVRRFRLGQVFRRGGRLVAIGTWTIDAGEGSDDHFVAVSSEGEVAVYHGTDPTNTADWSLVGVYYIGRPVGPRSLFKLGGDLLLITDRGLYPLSRALQSATIDRTSALTDKISEAFRQKAAALFGNFGWECCLHTSESFLLVNVPDNPKVQYVMDLLTGSWSRFTGWDASCFCYFNGSLYYGTTGKTVQAYVGTSDLGAAIPATVLTGYNYFAPRGGLKHVKLLRLIFAANRSFSYSVRLLGDFVRDAPPVNLSVQPSGSAFWDVDLWDSAVWASDYELIKSWQTVPNNPAYNFGLFLQISSKDATVQWLSTDCILARGGLK